MTARVRAWLEETHSDNFELVRHFASGFFDSEMLSIPGEWLKVAVGVLAVLLSAGFLALTTYYQSFNMMEGAGLSRARIFQEIRADELSFIAIAAGITALLTALEWQALFPSKRDCLALAGLPVSVRQIFLAKFGALVLMFAVFAIGLNLPWAMEFATTTAGHWENEPSGFLVTAANFAATAGACAFVFFSLLALQGILLNLLPARLFERVSLIVQSAVLIATLGALPLFERQPIALWWPPVWFLHLWEAMLKGPAGACREALLAIAVPAAISVAAYLLSYHRYRRLLLEGKPGHAQARMAYGLGAWLLERFMPDPRQQAAFAFMWKTLARSRTHRLILLAYGGIALGALTKGALDMPRPTLRDQGLYGLLVVLGPLAISLLVTVGLRYLFALPDSVRANWIFQITDREGSGAWLRAMERFVYCAIAPIFVAALPAAIAILGWTRALAATVLTSFCALLWFELLFRRWRKLPFTCSYLPGKQPVFMTLVRYAFATSLLGPIGQLVLYCSAELTAFIALLTFEVAMWFRWRSARRRAWSECALCYEEFPEAEIMTLGLRQPLAEPEALRGTTAATTPDAAFQPTLLGAGGILPAAWRQEIRDERRHPWLLVETLLEDARFALRLIRRNPLWSATVVLTLTVGIGINASVFTVVSGVALRPHVENDPASFVRIFPVSRRQGTPRGASFAEYAALRDQSRSLRQVAALTFMPMMMGDDDFSDNAGLAVSCNFFAVDGLDRPILGRLFVPDDCRTPGQMPVAVIDESVWHTRFGSDPHLPGRLTRINSRPVMLIGVIPNTASRWIASRHLGVWMPYTALTYFEPDRDVFRRDDLLDFDLAGRLRRGFTRERAQAELTVLEHRQDRLHAGRRTSVSVTDGSWSEEWDLRASARDLMLMAFFFATFNLVLFIACANVATLLLSRASARRREIAVRLSLGISRVRLVRMLVTESLLLAVCAGCASMYLAWRVPKPLYSFLASKMPDFPMPPDWRTFAYIAAVVLITGIFAGVAPALESLKVELIASLKGASGMGALLGTGSGTRLRGLLVSAQVALSMVLLVEAGLFARSEQRALRADPGYAPSKVVVAYVRFPDSSKPETAPARLEAIAQRMRRLPGVRGVAFSDGLPLLRPETVELRPPSRRDASQPVDIFSASPAFFATLGLPIVRGREFKESDGPAVIVSQSLARAFWPRQDAIGRMVPLPGGAAQVVGVAGDIAPMRLGGSDNPPLYRLRQVNTHRNMMSVRFDSDVTAGAAAIRSAMREVEPRLFVYPMPLQNWIDRITENLWNVASLIVVLGVVATVLATTGIYGAVSFAVNQRTRDLGIRVALGATRLDLIREIFVSCGRPVLHGLIVGLWLAVPTAVGLRESVRGSPIRIDSGEPFLYCAAALLLAAAAALAMLGPARRGARADPLEALRCE